MKNHRENRKTKDFEAFIRVRKIFESLPFVSLPPLPSGHYFKGKLKGFRGLRLCLLGYDMIIKRKMKIFFSGGNVNDCKIQKSQVKGESVINNNYQEVSSCSNTSDDSCTSSDEDSEDSSHSLEKIKSKPRNSVVGYNQRVGSER